MTFFKIGFTALLILASINSQTKAYASNEVAYIEEITILPDGTQHIQKYKPGQKPMPIRFDVPPETQKPRQRELNRIEKEELYRLEAEFAQGRITQTEYNIRKRELYRRTFVDGGPSDADLFW